MSDSKGKKKTLTARAVETLKLRQVISERLGYGAGSLEAVGTLSGTRYFFRCGQPRQRIALPDFNADGERLSLAEARSHARALSARYLAGERDLKLILQDEQRQAAKEREAARLEAEAKANAGKTSLGALLETYLKALERAGKQSHKNAESALRLHVEKASPDLWKKQASEVNLDDLLELLEPLVEAGKLRTAAIVRSLIRAAYGQGLRARNSPQASAFRRFHISHNPAADVATIEGAVRARDRALSLEELRALWQRLSEPGEPAGALFRAYLLTGGQRFSQLRRVQDRDITDEGLIIWDNKGRRSQPRRHVVPLIDEARAALEELRQPRLGPYVFTLTKGESGADISAARKMLKDIEARMIQAGQLTAPFCLSDLRRTVETRLAGAGIHSDVLAQLQSHGLSGVQWRHYNRYDYQAEKVAALETLRDLMTKPPASVTKLHARTRRGPAKSRGAA